MVKAPCMDCCSRVVGCHSSCEKYIEYKTEREAILAEKRKRNEFSYQVKRQIQECIRKSKK